MRCRPLPPRPLRTAQVLCLASVLLLGACERDAAPAPPYRVTLPMAELMTLVFDPAADVIWGSAGYVVTAEGERSLAPTDAAGWDRVRYAAVTLAEASNLLLLPGRAVDAEDWREFSLALAVMGDRARAAADTEDAEALFAAGADLYQVCVACHMQYDAATADHGGAATPGNAP